MSVRIWNEKEFLTPLSILGPEVWLLRDTAPGAGVAGEAANKENKIFSKRNFL